MRELVNQIGTIGQDNLIAKLSPAAECFGVTLTGTAGTTVKRGTVLGRSADGKYSVFVGAEEKSAEFNGDGSTTTFTVTDKPAAILGVKVGTADATVSDYNPYTGVVTLSSAPAAGTKNVKVSYVLDSGSVPAAILADDVTFETGETEKTAVAYRTGNFNRSALITGNSYELTAADEDALRKYQIILTDPM